MTTKETLNELLRVYAKWDEDLQLALRNPEGGLRRFMGRNLDNPIKAKLAEIEAAEAAAKAEYDAALAKQADEDRLRAIVREEIQRDRQNHYGSGNLQGGIWHGANPPWQERQKAGFDAQLAASQQYTTAERIARVNLELQRTTTQRNEGAK